jgi:hypothetical protein
MKSFLQFLSANNQLFRFQTSPFKMEPINGVEQLMDNDELDDIESIQIDKFHTQFGSYLQNNK